MARLKNRNSQIPNGLKFKIAPLKYQARPFSSFDTIVQEVQRVVRANPWQAKKFSYPTERPDIENWVDSYNAQICDQNGWLQYIDGGPDGGEPSPPSWLPPSVTGRYGKNVAAGAKSLLSWLGEGMRPVPSEQAEKRSLICAKCPKNRQMELKDAFVRATSELIRRQIEFSKEAGLRTTSDPVLGICDACSCPLKLMVHVPLAVKLEHMPKESYDELDSKCWVLSEKNETTKQNENIN